MDVQVKHNGVDITTSVISYEREHKICTGIGILRLEVNRTIGRTFDPWDTVDIHENGNFQVRYYISQVDDNIPQGKLTIDCQDESKKLVDYFIPDSYNIDYPTYTRFWIEKFLDEADVNYEFRTNTQGNLLSNHTQLGLKPLYEEILTLLQISGWYMFFDGNGKAVIGPLNVDLSTTAGSINGDDITSILRISDDKMLRNRALVLGAYDLFARRYATADITVNTRWNYDRRDVRAMVVSNQNIPNSGTAHNIANILLKEFARITIEKHIIIHGARNYDLGRALRVDSRIWRGKGLITTFGVKMSKNGLETHLILDERCPRLFGYFNFGDYVYVGTYGDGIWRKHIKHEHTWHDFSSGLTDLRITDLHINDGVFGAVGASGQMYYNYGGDGSWIPLTVMSLESSSETVVDLETSSGIEYSTFSGIMARAVIVDKNYNTIKFGVDTWSGLNYGDYFIDSASGWITASGEHRGWILEYDPLTGQLVGGLGSGIYPISISGQYNISVIDLENDGYNDYVSVKTVGNLITGDDELQDYNYGVAGGEGYNQSGLVSLSNVTGSPSNILVLVNNSSIQVSHIGMVDNDSDHEFFYLRQVIPNAWQLWIKRYQNNNIQLAEIDEDIVTLSSGKSPYPTITGFKVPGTIVRVGQNSYRFLVTGGSGVELVTVTHLGGGSYDVDYQLIDQTDAEKTRHLAFQNGKKVLITYTGEGTNAFDTELYTQVVDLSTGTHTGANLIYSSGGTSTDRKDLLYRLFPDGEDFQIVGWQVEYETAPFVDNDCYEIHGNESSLVKGSLHFTSTAFPTLPQEPTSMSRVWAGMIVSADGNQYANYGKGLLQSAIGANIERGGPINSPAHDNYTFRVSGSFPSTKLQINTIPTLSTWTDIPTPDYSPITPAFFIPDSVTGIFYIRARKIADSTEHVIGVNIESGTVVSSFSLSGSESATPSTNGLYNVGNMFITVFENASLRRSFDFRIVRNLTPPKGEGGGYKVLQRRGSEFVVIEEESYPIRVDISNSTPVLTVGSGVNSFVSNFVNVDEVLVVESPITFSGQVRDYRYVISEEIGGETSISGVAAIKQVLYVEGSGVFSADLATFSGFEQIYTIPSGYGDRLETSNYTYSGQYVFITTSGEYPAFYQKEPGSFVFDIYSGLPESRATIIRLDDRI